MGMFDNVNFEMDCPKCGTNIKGFQSKDSYCTLATIDPTAVDHFYSSCSKCDNWIDVIRNELPDPEPPRETPYTLDEVKELGFRMDSRHQ